MCALTPQSLSKESACEADRQRVGQRGEYRERERDREGSVSQAANQQSPLSTGGVAYRLQFISCATEMPKLPNANGYHAQKAHTHAQNTHTYTHITYIHTYT